MTAAVPTYTREEVYRASLDYFDGNELQAGVFTDKYALRDRDSRFYELTPTDMHRRLAKEFARIEQKYPNPLSEEYIFKLLDRFQWIVPQGSPMFGVGNPFQIVSTSNCAVLPAPEDTMSSIFDTARDMANLYKRRFGVGTDLSGLRPAGAPVSNAAVTSTGAWSFADFYSYITRMVGQSGRRGALMLTMDVRHPDIERFIDMKRDLTKVTGANVSVKVTDEFMQAVENDAEFLLQWPVDAPPMEAKVWRYVSARELFRKIAASATEMGEPGLLFWDTITRNLALDQYPGFKTVGTNPCGEVPLSGFDSCRLMSIYLPSFVKLAFTPEAYFDWNTFADVVQAAQRLSDDLVDLELEKLHAIRAQADTDDERALFDNFIRACEQGRRTGLGTHGLADALARLGVKYDSEEGLTWADKIYGDLKDWAYLSSIDMAKERGPFPIWDWETEKDCAFFSDLPPSLMDYMRQYGRRNGALLTNAPTGSVSILSDNCSSGIEPVFMNSYWRKRKVDAAMGQVTPDYIDATGDAWVSYEVFHRNVEQYRELHPEGPLPEYFVTAAEIDPIMRVRMQAMIQQHIDHSLSSTLNLPRETTPDVVERIYMEAWRAGCKGVTVYRDGSREAQVLSATESASTATVTTVLPEEDTPGVDPKEFAAALARINWLELENEQLQAARAACDHRTHRGTTTEGTMFKAAFRNMDNRERKVYVYVGQNEKGQPVEVFVHDEQGDEDLRPYAAAVGKLISLALKYGIAPEVVAEALIGLKGGSVSYTGKVYQSVPDLIGKQLLTVQPLPVVRKAVAAETLTVGDVVTIHASATVRPASVMETGDTRQPVVSLPGEKCPQCGQQSVIRESGCPTCKSCGWARCS